MISNLSTTLNNVPELRRVNKMIKCVGSPHSDVTGGELVTLSTWEINNVQVEVLHVDDDDRTMFNATRLYLDLCPSPNPKRDGFQQTWFNTLVTECPDDVKWITLKRPGERKTTDVFMDWLYLRDVVKTIDPRAAVWWLSGNAFDPTKLSEGYVYLVQPAKHRGSTVFKVGQSMNLAGRMSQYGTKRNELRAVCVDNRYLAEKQLKDEFKKRFDKHSDGDEYYECGSIELAKLAWDSVWLRGIDDEKMKFSRENEARDSDDTPPSSSE